VSRLRKDNAQERWTDLSRSGHKHVTTLAQNAAGSRVPVDIEPAQEATKRPSCSLRGGCASTRPRPMFRGGKVAAATE